MKKGKKRKGNDDWPRPADYFQVESNFDAVRLWMKLWVLFIWLWRVVFMLLRNLTAKKCIEEGWFIPYCTVIVEIIIRSKVKGERQILSMWKFVIVRWFEMYLLIISWLYDLINSIELLITDEIDGLRFKIIFTIMIIVIFPCHLSG